MDDEGDLFDQFDEFGNFIGDPDTQQTHPESQGMTQENGQGEKQGE